MLLHLGSKPAIIVSSAQVASKVLRTYDLIFASRPNHLRFFRRILANGKDMLSSPYGEYWRQMRSIWVQHLLSIKRVRSFRSMREEDVALMMNEIRGLSIVNLSEMFMSLTNDMVCRLAFGKKYMGERGGVDFKKLLDEVFRLLGEYYVGDFISGLAWIDRVNGVEAKVSQVANALDDILEEIIQEHLERRKQKNGEGEDFVDVLLEVQQENTSGNSCLDRESIKGLILDIFAAGTVTTSASLEWMMSELLRNPRVMKALQKEIRGTVGDKDVVAEDDLKNMKYLKAVIKETLRLHPSAPLTPPHECTKDVKVNGRDVDAGTLLIVNLWSISRDPEYWDEPEKFYPERFLDSPIDFKGRDFQFIPFGSGRRICPGIAFAIASLELVIANLVHQFDWALPNGMDETSLDMTEAPGQLAVQHRKNPLLAIPTPRVYQLESV